MHRRLSIERARVEGSSPLSGRVLRQRVKVGSKHAQLPECGRQFPRLSQFLEPQVGIRSGLAIIIDLSELATYDSGYRAGWTQWLHDHTARVHLYSPSRIVRMGAAVVHLATDKITAYDSLSALYAFASKTVPGFAPSAIPAPRAARAFG